MENKYIAAECRYLVMRQGRRPRVFLDLYEANDVAFNLQVTTGCLTAVCRVTREHLHPAAIAENGTVLDWTNISPDAAPLMPMPGCFDGARFGLTPALRLRCLRGAMSEGSFTFWHDVEHGAAIASVCIGDDDGTFELDIYGPSRSACAEWFHQAVESPYGNNVVDAAVDIDTGAIEFGAIAPDALSVACSGRGIRFFWAPETVEYVATLAWGAPIMYCPFYGFSAGDASLLHVENGYLFQIKELASDGGIRLSRRLSRLVEVDKPPRGLCESVLALLDRDDTDEEEDDDDDL